MWHVGHVKGAKGRGGQKERGRVECSMSTGEVGKSKGKRGPTDLADNLRHPTKGLVAVYLAAGWPIQRIADTLEKSVRYIRKVSHLPAVQARVDELHRHLVVEIVLREMDK